MHTIKDTFFYKIVTGRNHRCFLIGFYHICRLTHADSISLQVLKAYKLLATYMHNHVLIWCPIANESTKG